MIEYDLVIHTAGDNEYMFKKEFETRAEASAHVVAILRIGSVCVERGEADGPHEVTLLPLANVVDMELREIQ